MEAIFRRRSVRQFTGDSVSREDIEFILRAGMQAPSAGNQQPWQFIVIDDQELLKGISAVHPYASMLPKAGCGILILGDLSREVHAGYWVQDCAACAENMLLAVTERNLGGGVAWRTSGRGSRHEYPQAFRARGIAGALRGYHHRPSCIASGAR